VTTIPPAAGSLESPSPAQSAIFGPVRAPTAFEETAERLGTAIKVGLLAPGSRLPPERELAEQLAISRSTLRQSLGVLVESGYLTVRRGRGGGTFVAQAIPRAEPDPRYATAEDRRAALDLRIAVETGAVALAAERAGPGALDRLDALVARMDEAGAFSAYRLADARFHIGIAEASGAPAVVAAMTEVQAAMDAMIAMIGHPHEVLARSNDQHRRLVAALRRGDAGRCVALLRTHLKGTEHIIEALLPATADPLTGGTPPV
jgi:GntR family transcriptional repressor for pyruvate dehydrogenase complex